MDRFEKLCTFLNLTANMPGVRNKAVIKELVRELGIAPDEVLHVESLLEETNE